MTRAEIVGIGVALLAVAVYIGKLDATVNSLNLADDRDQALKAIADARNESIAAMESAMSSAIAAQSNASLHTDVYHWTAGAPPVRLIRVVDGVCYLTMVAGSFNSRRDMVFIEPIGDHWALDGRAGGSNIIAAEAHCWRFPRAE